MVRLHTHHMFGQQNSHSVLFHHTNREDQEAHDSEVEDYRRLNPRNDPSKSPDNVSDQEPTE